MGHTRRSGGPAHATGAVWRLDSGSREPFGPTDSGSKPRRRAELPEVTEVARSPSVAGDRPAGLLPLSLPAPSSCLEQPPQAKACPCPRASPPEASSTGYPGTGVSPPKTRAQTRGIGHPPCPSSREETVRIRVWGLWREIDRHPRPHYKLGKRGARWGRGSSEPRWGSWPRQRRVCTAPQPFHPQHQQPDGRGLCWGSRERQAPA